MNIQDAVDVIESVSGFTDESTPVGEAWLEVLSFISCAQPKPVAPTDEELIRPIVWMIDDSVYDNDKGEIVQSLRELVARWGQP